MSSQILSVKGLTCPLEIEGQSYNVVDHLSFDLHLGKTLAIVGESGCGKTLSALSIIGCLPKPPCLQPLGEVIYQGKNLLTLKESQMRKIRGGKIAMIFQDPQSSLNPVYTIGWQLLEAVSLHTPLRGEDAWKRAVDALDEVGIVNPQERMDSYPHQLSGGMKQRVMIAMALIGEPDILIADEPTTALDVTIQKQVLDLMKELQKRRGMAILLITHDIGVVAKSADEVIVMYCAQKVEEGNVRDVLQNPSHPYTMGLFASRPDPLKPQGELKPIRGSVPMLSQYPQGCRFHPRCPFAMEKCKAGQVPDFPLSGGQVSKCWLHDGTKESLEKFEWRAR
jgi:oligopeptide/dipeptide ABC transporter ATP-binding protein